MRFRGAGVRVFKSLLVLGVLAGVVVGFLMLTPYGPATETFVEIAPGTGTAAIARQLQKAGVIRSTPAFEAVKEWRSISRATGTLKAGEYRFDHAATVAEVYDRLLRGDVYTVTVVIPEGFNIFDVAGTVAASGLDTRDDFLAAEQGHTELIAAWSPRASSLEGFLFPDTYKFSRHATPLQMLTAMVKRFGQQAKRLGLSTNPLHEEQPGMSGEPTSAQQLVTMASLVEKEVHVDAERPMVASVFRNRLAAGMPLQTDPAVIYASLLRGTWTGVIHESELRSDSAYNTYTHTGLPPGPICNPGLAALRAALHPATTSYLYFVADANGATRFAKTLADHNANVSEYRRVRK